MDDFMKGIQHEIEKAELRGFIQEKLEEATLKGYVVGWESAVEALDKLGYTDAAKILREASKEACGVLK